MPSCSRLRCLRSRGLTESAGCCVEGRARPGAPRASPSKAGVCGPDRPVMQAKFDSGLSHKGASSALRVPTRPSHYRRGPSSRALGAVLGTLCSFDGVVLPAGLINSNPKSEGSARIRAQVQSRKAHRAQPVAAAVLPGMSSGAWCMTAHRVLGWWIWWRCPRAWDRKVRRPPVDTFETFDIAPMPGSQGTMCRSPTRVPAFTCMDRFRHTHSSSALSLLLLWWLLLLLLL